MYVKQDLPTRTNQKALTKRKNLVTLFKLSKIFPEGLSEN